MFDTRNNFTGRVKKIEDSEFDDEYQVQVPSVDEVRLVANRRTQCQYYARGVDYCRNKVIRLAIKPENAGYQDGFLPCKRVVDANYRCLTDNKFGDTLEEAPQEAQRDADAYLNCAFKKLFPIEHCQRYLHGVLRELRNIPGSALADSE